MLMVGEARFRGAQVAAIRPTLFQAVDPHAGGFKVCIFSGAVGFCGLRCDNRKRNSFRSVELNVACMLDGSILVPIGNGRPEKWDRRDGRQIIVLKM